MAKLLNRGGILTKGLHSLNSGTLAKGLQSFMSSGFPPYKKDVSRLFISRQFLRQQHIQSNTRASVSDLQKSIRNSQTYDETTSNDITRTNLSNRNRIFKDITKPLMTSDAKKLPVQKTIQHSIRQMKKEDLPHIYDMLDEQGWVIEKAYLECAFDTDPSGFIVAETAAGEVIGSHGFLSHGGKVASAGLWMVKKSHRNSNIGLKLYEELSKRLGSQNFGTFMWPYYLERVKENHGVEPATNRTYMTWYNHGRIEPRTCADSSNADVEITCLQDADMNELLEYDTQIHTVPRELYMKNWINHECSKTYIAKRKNTVVGYGVLRSQDHYNQIAPLYADDKGIAKALFGALGAEVPKGEKVGFSSPFENNSATEFSAINKMMKPGIPLIMLYKNNPVNVDTNKVFAVSSNSFGTC